MKNGQYETYTHKVECAGLLQVGRCLSQDGRDIHTRMAGAEKSHVNEAAYTATNGQPFVFQCKRHLTLKITGRGKGLVVNRDRHGMPRRRNDGTPCAAHRQTPPRRWHASTVRSEQSCNESNPAHR